MIAMQLTRVTCNAVVMTRLLSRMQRVVARLLTA